MSRARIQLEPAWLLSARPYADTSLLLEAFSRDHGRVGLVARGARAPRAKLRGLLQPLQPLLLSWTESGELGTVTGAESAGPGAALSGERVFFGWYVNELVLRLLQRHDPHPQLYDRYATTLAQLAGDHAQAALRLFERDLLAETGYGLTLPDDVDPALSYAYDPEAGLRIAETPGSYAGASLIALRDGELEGPRALADARKLLQAALAPQLGGRELETPRLLREMRGRREK